MQIKLIFIWKVLHKDDRFETDHKGDVEVAFSLTYVNLLLFFQRYL